MSLKQQIEEENSWLLQRNVPAYAAGKRNEPISTSLAGRLKSQEVDLLKLRLSSDQFARTKK